ncbi:stage III sporulation protein AF [Oceanirhabdus sp. W0125-5]|uniref:stage III sporulation protein AF n=1 Tax=Oceanirhabdus sp. W0125-5 TaxID=2999116 RepID=UPI0022F2B7A4|nr:stage III sporulation protein AF [Oceanirhabdus sp. W0125-5]WBW95330.1 stage III sporulation protein AF [Oceanirhabdus sp. W0125-5]
MIELIKEWIISICTMIVIMTGVELILPNNKLKKYCKFVMGLILMLVIINPIIIALKPSSAINVNFDEFNYEFQERDTYEYEKYRDKNIDRTLKVYRNNIEKECLKSLKEEYPDTKFSMDIEVSYDDSEGMFVIDEIAIGVNGNSSIKRVKPVVISKNKSVENENENKNNENLNKIKKHIGKLLDLEEKAVKVYSQDD